MRNKRQFLIMISMAFLLALPLATVSAQETGAEASCTATPSQLQATSSASSLEIEVNGSIGEIKSVEVEADSGIEVLEFGDEENTRVSLTLDTSGAASGTWLISVQGENGTCTTSVTVEAA